MSLKVQQQLIAVLSDSHNEIHRLRNAAVIMRRASVSAVIHCGDITSPDAVKTLGGFDAHWALGNCDWDEQALREAMRRYGHTCHGLQGEIELVGRRLAFTHGHRFELFKTLTAAREHDLVFHGHTHVRRDEMENGTRVVCPGALHHANPPGFALISLPDLELEWVDLQ